MVANIFKDHFDGTLIKFHSNAAKKSRFTFLLNTLIQVSLL